MAPRANRKIKGEPAKVERVSAVTTTPTSPAKKGRKKVKVEQVVETVTTRVPSRTKKEVKYEESDQEEEEEEEKEEEAIENPKTPVKRKINSVKGKATIEAEKSANEKKAPAKRKTKAEEQDGDEADAAKPKKKRKTKEEKEAEAMPILPRTAVSSLKKAMHIGAHVSGAGGMYYVLSRVITNDAQECKTQSTMHCILAVTHLLFSSNHNVNGKALL